MRASTLISIAFAGLALGMPKDDKPAEWKITGMSKGCNEVGDTLYSDTKGWGCTPLPDNGLRFKFDDAGDAYGLYFFKDGDCKGDRVDAKKNGCFTGDGKYKAYKVSRHIILG